MTRNEATRVLLRLRTADNALQAARLVTQDPAMQLRIGAVQMSVQRLLEQCEQRVTPTGPEAA